MPIRRNHRSPAAHAARRSRACPFTQTLQCTRSTGEDSSLCRYGLRSFFALSRLSEREDGRNPSFPRPEALLAVLMLTNQDDCSVADIEPGPRFGQFFDAIEAHKHPRIRGVLIDSVHGTCPWDMDVFARDIVEWGDL